MATKTKAQAAPAADAPKATKARATKPAAAVAVPTPVEVDAAAKAAAVCLCGCGRETKGRFAPGHDARLRGVLLRAQAAAHTGDAVQVARSSAELTAMGLQGGTAAQARLEAAIAWWTESHPADRKQAPAPKPPKAAKAKSA